MTITLLSIDPKSEELEYICLLTMHSVKPHPILSRSMALVIKDFVIFMYVWNCHIVTSSNLTLILLVEVQLKPKCLTSCSSVTAK